MGIAKDFFTRTNIEYNDVSHPLLRWIFKTRDESYIHSMRQNAQPLRSRLSCGAPGRRGLKCGLSIKSTARIASVIIIIIIIKRISRAPIYHTKWEPHRVLMITLTTDTDTETHRHTHRLTHSDTHTHTHVTHTHSHTRARAAARTPTHSSQYSQSRQ